MLRQNEADLINQIRHAQDPDRFSKMTEAGSRLSQQQAVAAIRRRHGTGTADPDPGTKPDHATGPTPGDERPHATLRTSTVTRIKTAAWLLGSGPGPPWSWPPGWHPT